MRAEGAQPSDTVQRAQRKMAERDEAQRAKAGDEYSKRMEAAKESISGADPGAPATKPIKELKQRLVTQELIYTPKMQKAVETAMAPYGGPVGGDLAGRVSTTPPSASGTA